MKKNERRCLALKISNNKQCTRDIKPNPKSASSHIVCWQHNDDYEKELTGQNITRKSSLDKIKAAHKNIIEERRKSDRKAPKISPLLPKKNPNQRPETKTPQVSTVETNVASSGLLNTDETEDISGPSKNNTSLNNDAADSKSAESADSQAAENSGNQNSNPKNGPAKGLKNKLTTKEFVGLIKYVAPLFAVLAAIYTHLLYLPDFNFIQYAKWEDFVLATVNPWLIFALVIYLYWLSGTESKLREQDEVKLSNTHAFKRELESRLERQNAEKNNFFLKLRNRILNLEIRKLDIVNKSDISNQETKIEDLKKKLNQDSIGYLADNFQTLDDIFKRLKPLVVLILVSWVFESVLSKTIFKKHVYISANEEFIATGHYEFIAELKDYYFFKQDKNSIVVPERSMTAIVKTSKKKKDKLLNNFVFYLDDKRQTTDDIAPVNNAIFTTNFFEDRKVVKSLDSRIILPFFINNVEPIWDGKIFDEKKKIIFKYKSFVDLKLGRDIDLKLNCKTDECRTSEYFESLKNTLLHCARNAKKKKHNFEIKIEGFASDQKFKGINNDESNELNYILAEGRRNFIIKRLGFENKKGDGIYFSGLVDNDAKVYLTKGEGEGLSDQWKAIQEYAEKYGYGFNHFDDMRTGLKGRLGGEVSTRTGNGGNSENTAVSEAFERSVVISFAPGSLKYCSA